MLEIEGLSTMLALSNNRLAENSWTFIAEYGYYPLNIKKKPSN
jgi:hypothetical protein